MYFIHLFWQLKCTFHYTWLCKSCRCKNPAIIWLPAWQRFSHMDSPWPLFLTVPSGLGTLTPPLAIQPLLRRPFSPPVYCNPISPLGPLSQSHSQATPWALMYEESANSSTLSTLPFLGYLSSLSQCSIFIDNIHTRCLTPFLPQNSSPFWMTSMTIRLDQLDVVLSAPQLNDIFFHSTSGNWSQGHILDLSLEFPHFSNLKFLYARNVLATMCHHSSSLVL